MLPASGEINYSATGPPTASYPAQELCCPKFLASGRRDPRGGTRECLAHQTVSSGLLPKCQVNRTVTGHSGKYESATGQSIELPLAAVPQVLALFCGHGLHPWKPPRLSLSLDMPRAVGTTLVKFTSC